MSDRIVIGPRISPTEFARELRRDATDAERFLWQRLRNGALGVKFRRQHPLAGYVLDFCCLGHRLVIELDGISTVIPRPSFTMRSATRRSAELGSASRALAIGRC
jgi:very-short-patch-repair endonuclease